jgi:DUF1680 family protein
MVEEDVNQVCVERGPLVYCVESPDAQVGSIDELFLLSDAQFEPQEMEISGKRVLALTALAAVLKKEGHRPDALYQPLRVSGYETLPIRLIPYFAWDNRALGRCASGCHPVSASLTRLSREIS